VQGSSFGDVITGNAAANALYGNDGNDVMVGGAGNDILNGGNGIDAADYSVATTAVTVDLRKTTSQTTGTGTGSDTLVDIENITGGNVRDHLTGNSVANVLLGLNGNDAMEGLGGNDILDGGNSNDILQGGGGDDRLVGGDGNDTLSGGDGIDTADYTGDGRVLNVSLAIATAQDTGYGSDTLSSIENVTGGTGNDRLLGSTGANVIRGGGGNDIASGLGGDDVLYGDAGDDNIAGGAGNDRMDGGAGLDELLGGAGADTFAFTVVAYPAERDTVDDFQQGVDRIDVSGIDANVFGLGDQAFTFIGDRGNGNTTYWGKAFLGYFSDGAGNTIIAGGVDDDGVADFQILLKGAYTLQVSDLVL